MPDGIEAKDLLEKLDSYHAEIVSLARETTASVTTLESAIKIVNDSKKKWWVVHKNVITFVVTLFAILIFVIGVAITMSHTKLCVVNIAGSGKTADLTSCNQ